MGLLDSSSTTGYEPLDKYLPHGAAAADSMSLPEQLVHGAVATVADIGTTYWNSLTPDRFNASTVDLLGRIDQDALQIYNEHPDTIKTLSFLGGIVAPVGLAMKGMSLLRAGTSGFSWFSEAGQLAKMEAVESAFAKAGYDAAYQATKWSLYRGVALNAVADNVAAEAAIVMTLSSHPMMEDYYKDFGSNFVKSVAFGSVLQTGLGSIILKGDISKRIAPIQQVANDILKENIYDPMVAAGISPFSHTGTELAARLQGVERVRGILDEAKLGSNPRELTPFTIKALEHNIVMEEGRLALLLKESAQGDFAKYLETAPDEMKRFYFDFIQRESNAALDKIGFATVKGTTAKITDESAVQLSDTTSLVGTIVSKVKNALGQEVEQNVRTDAIFLPWASEGAGAYISKRNGAYFLTVADLGKSLQELEKGIDKRWGVTNLSDWSYELGSLHTAIADKEFAQAMLWAEKLDANTINKVVVDPEHLPLLKALFTRANQLKAEDGTFQLSVRITKAAPSWEAQQRAALATKGGVPADYIQQLVSVEKEFEKYILYHTSKGRYSRVSSAAESALMGWIGGNGINYLRNGAALWRKMIPDTSAIKEVSLTRMQDAANLLDEMYNSATSRAMRDRLRQLADVDGNIWLYRGMNRDPSGHASLESYALLPEKAAEFGHGYHNAVKMYKVNVDDIVVGMYDFGHGDRPEILAIPPTRDWEQISKSKLRELPDTLVIHKVEEVNINKTQKAMLSSIDDLEKTMIEAQRTLVMDLKSKGFGIETIALKTGTPEDTIKRILETGRVEGAGLIKYGNVGDVEMALDVKRRALALSADSSKILQPNVYAQLDAMNLDAISSDLAQMYIMTSKSEFVQSLGTTLFSPNMKEMINQLYNYLPDVVGAKLKNSKFASTNQVMEALGPVGIIANAIGKEVIHIKNSLKEAFEKPIATLMGNIIKEGEATIIEANTALMVNASIKGRRFYKAGSIWIPDNVVSNEVMHQLMAMPEADFIKAFEEGLFESGIAKAQLNNKDYNIATPVVREFFEKLQDYGKEMFEFKRVYNKAIGRKVLNDIGLWIPSFNPRNKSIAYVYDMQKDTTSMLYAANDELLATGIAGYENALLQQYGKDWGSRFRIIPKSQQEMYNQMAGRHDSLYMQAADLSKQHGGSSASTVVSTDTEVFKDLLQGYQTHVSDGIERLTEMHLNTTMRALKDISDTSQGLYSAATKGVLAKLLSKPVDVGQTVRNILLGRPMLSEHTEWSELQQRAQVFTDIALKSVTEIFEPVVSAALSKSTKIRTPEEWTKITQEMESKGIVNPFESLDKEFGLGRYLMDGKTGNQMLTPRAIALGNGLAATLLLRFMELGQPLVNAMSLPILTSAAVNRKLSSSFMGAELAANAKFSVASQMANGIRLMNHPEMGPYISAIGESKGIFSIELRQVTEILEHQRSLDPGILTKAEQLLDSLSKRDSKLNWFVRGSDLSEGIVRRVTFFTGWDMATKAYPGLSDAGKLAFARNFMDEAIGNYTSAQRPAMFQGTVGVAMGLFQTYMLTLAQNIYRQVEHRDWASLSKLLLLQSSIFGASSLPGFHIVSEAIGKNFSDQHIDLETGTFRAIKDPIANMLLYGIPSSIGPGVATRGDIQPRLPDPTNLSSLAVVNLSSQAYTAMERVATAAYHADENAGRAMLEAISLQSLSRPLARIAELITGRSITSKGDIVAEGPEIYNTQGVISRIFSTRPVSEIKAREALHVNTLYNRANGDRHEAVINRLKSHIRNGTGDGDAIDKLAEEYLRTGTSTGWKAAVNDAIRQEGATGAETTLRKFKKDSPLSLMIEDLS